MNNICAIYKKKKLKTHWGFVFNTNIQSYVEIFMTRIAVNVEDYWLSYEKDKPEGVYTDVKVTPTFGEEGQTIDVKFEL